MKVQKMNNRYLILEDGSSYQGIGFGAPIIATGELAVETANFGYQESLTDQTNSGRILVFTTPIIGASGISAIDYESINPSVKGIVVNELAIKIAGSHSFQDLDQFLREKNIPGIYQIDTRNIVKKFSTMDVQKASIMDTDDQHAIDQIKALVLPKNKVQNTSTVDAYAAPNIGKTVAIIDLGLKHSLLRELSLRQINSVVLPYNVSLEEILNLRPDGIIISNGPGKINSIKVDLVEIIRALQSTIPIMGIGLGYLALSQFLNLEIVDLRPNYIGSNYPVLNTSTSKIWQTAMNIQQITKQPETVDVVNFSERFVDLHQNYLAGYIWSDKKMIGVGFNPEGSPGNFDARHIFDIFVKMME